MQLFGETRNNYKNCKKKDEKRKEKASGNYNPVVCIDSNGIRKGSLVRQLLGSQSQS